MLVASVAEYIDSVKSIWLASGDIVKIILLMLLLKPALVALSALLFPNPKVCAIAGELIVIVRAAKAPFAKKIVTAIT